jgi:hypothetical protein
VSQAAALKDKLKASFKRQAKFIDLAQDEPELWHKVRHLTGGRGGDRILVT